MQAWESEGTGRGMGTGAGERGEESVGRGEQGARREGLGCGHVRVRARTGAEEMLLSCIQIKSSTFRSSFATECHAVVCTLVQPSM